MFPFTGLRLLFPAIVPSWRFFDAVSASPRIDVALIATPAGSRTRWREFRPRPAVLTPAMMLRRLLWNAEWNENLYLVSLAERLLSDPSPATQAHSERELAVRIARDLARHDADAAFFRFRIRLVERVGPGDVLASQTAYRSPLYAIATLAAA